MAAGNNLRSKGAAPKRRRRLSPALRREQILDAAAELVAKQGFLPLSIERLGEAAGSSKALTYTYFPTQYDLFNALLKREIGGLATAGLDAASRVHDLKQAAVLCAMLYFEHVVRSGPLIHILISDLYMAGHVDPQATCAANDMLSRLNRLARKELKLSKMQVVAAMSMLAAIPEESGSLAYHKELSERLARELCHTLTLSSLEALRAPNRRAVLREYTA